MSIDREAAKNLRPVTAVASMLAVPGTLYLAVADNSPWVLLVFPLFFCAAFVFCLAFFLLAHVLWGVLSSMWLLIAALMEEGSKG